MLRFVRGVPGSGKSYYAVNYLLKFCTYDKLYEDYKVNPGCLIISNIENLNINHLDLDKCIEEYTFEKFFSVTNFTKIRDTYRVQNIVLIIDESQRYFPIDFKDTDVFYFFQYHRHLGVDVILLSQSAKTVAYPLLVLSEYIIEAVPRSKGLPFVFRYKFFDIKDNYLYTEVIKKDELVYRAYKSFDINEISKPKNIYKMYLLILIALIGLIVFVFVFIMPMIFQVPESPNPVIADNASAVKPSSAEASQPIKKPTIEDKMKLVDCYADNIVSVRGDRLTYYVYIKGVKSTICLVKDFTSGLVACPTFELERIDAIAVAAARSGGEAQAANKRPSDSRPSELDR